MKARIVSLLIIMTNALFCHGQGFVNLNFESASFVPISGDPYNGVQFAQAFPGWTGTVGGINVTRALSNGVFLDTAGISIINSNYNSGGFGGLIQGRYTAILQSGTLTNTQTGVDTRLFQTGAIPSGTKSIQFQAYEAFDSSGSFNVTLDGTALALVALAAGNNYTLYGADISSWAGQTAQLAFDVPGVTPHRNDEYLYLDAIQFSSQSIPEPGTLALSVLGMLLFGQRRWRNPSSTKLK
jgi:hypothetical protein